MITFDEPLNAGILLLARILLALLYLVSGIHKALWYEKAVAEFRAARVPLVSVTLPATIVLHCAASICLIVGMYVIEASLALALFTLLATERAHGFWRFEGAARLERGRAALANFGVISGLLLLAVVGPGNLVFFS
jgi:putative oxidoreductase